MPRASVARTEATKKRVQPSIYRILLVKKTGTQNKTINTEAKINLLGRKSSNQTLHNGDEVHDNEVGVHGDLHDDDFVGAGPEELTMTMMMMMMMMI